MTRQQELTLELISLAINNDLNGKKVAKDLRNNQHLWVSAYGYFCGHVGLNHLIPLRDMHSIWHIDSIAISCKREHKNELVALIKKWKPHDIYVYKDIDEGEDIKNYLRRSGAEVLINVWWD